MNDTPFPPPSPESEPLDTTDPTADPTSPWSSSADQVAADPAPAEPDPAAADQPDPVATDTGGRSSHGRRPLLAVGAVGVGGLLAVSGWLALAGDGHADDTAVRVDAAGVAGATDTTADEQLDATSQIDVDVDDDEAAPGADRGGHHGGRPGRGGDRQGQMGEQGMGATAATPGAVPASGSGGS